MDYDILLTTRIRENVRKGKSNDGAITYAVERSGAIITICGFIMAGAFSTLMLSSAPMIQEFGLDSQSLLMRCLSVPMWFRRLCISLVIGTG